MDKRLKISIVAAALLAGVGAFHHFVPSGSEQARQNGRNALEHCMQAAQMIYDVHWAAACMTEAAQASSGGADGHAECDLPDAKAAVVNAWLNKAEERCMAEVRAGLDGIGSDRQE